MTVWATKMVLRFVFPRQNLNCCKKRKGSSGHNGFFLCKLRNLPLEVTVFSIVLRWPEGVRPLKVHFACCGGLERRPTPLAECVGESSFRLTRKRPNAEPFTAQKMAGRSSLFASYVPSRLDSRQYRCPYEKHYVVARPWLLYCHY
jgi:hypothetical protein